MSCYCGKNWCYGALCPCVCHRPMTLPESPNSDAIVDAFLNKHRPKTGHPISRRTIEDETAAKIAAWLLRVWGSPHICEQIERGDWRKT